ncbi:hypothetical protein H9P43_007507 [Blastocladiella emersonii ATCC 22665]|nr:hypothetical protein H9P43_007507 [Blastocladiella emersonii ATCC 22665]
MSSLLAHYASDSEGSDVETPSNKKIKLAAVSSAPDVGIEVTLYNLQDQTSREITHNVPYDALALPVVGPANPLAESIDVQNGRIGNAELFAIGATDFNTQLRRFNNAAVRGKANAGKATASGLHFIDDDEDAATRRTVKRKRKAAGNVAAVEGDDAYQGPWAGFVDDDDMTLRPRGDGAEGEDEELDVEAAMRYGGDDEDDPSAVAGDWTVDDSATALVPSANPKSRLITPGAERSIFHGKPGTETDYQGRTYMHPPTVDGVDLSPNRDPPTAFLPKRCIHTYRGHTAGVNAIRLLPGTGHLVLSASMDGKVKLWDVYNDRRVLRTFLGHNKAVRDVTFNNDGRQFLSASFDKFCKLWDTETGKCISTFTTGKVPLCVQFHPEKQHIFLAGQQDKKVVQYDARSGEVIQEYDQHLGPVNTITFVDHNRRFVTTSDDKSLRAWEFDVPVVIKYVAEPDMHSMPAVTLSPNKKWLACQSLDNQVYLYAATDKFRLNRKKVFRGHLVAGYACQVGFSADGQYLMSGDSTGSMNFWDFKTSKLVKKFKAHDKVVMSCVWHPHETSKVLTCSWDGTIKLWD